MQNGQNMTREAMKRAKAAENANKGRTLGSGDQRRNHNDVRRYKNMTP